MENDIARQSNVFSMEVVAYVGFMMVSVTEKYAACGFWLEFMSS